MELLSSGGTKLLQCTRSHSHTHSHSLCLSLFNQFQFSINISIQFMNYCVWNSLGVSTRLIRSFIRTQRAHHLYDKLAKQFTLTNNNNVSFIHITWSLTLSSLFERNVHSIFSCVCVCVCQQERIR